MDKICPQCSAAFTVTDDDLAFLEKVSPVFGKKKESIPPALSVATDVPPPTLCPDCRWQRRLCFRNERNLYRRTCDLSGKTMVSMHPVDAPFPVYHITEWLSDKWNPKDFGRAYDFSRSFFEQFRELVLATPHFSAFVDPSMDQNAEYTNCSSEAKNCYLITQAEKNEDCYYARGINNCKSCCDCLRVHRCELCYEGINLRNCYRCLWCQDCDNASDCFFSSDLRGCKHCFGCHGLVQKEYHIFNEPVLPAEWKERVGELVLTPSAIEQVGRQNEVIRLGRPHRSARLMQCERSSGDNLLNCKNARECFDCNDLEDCAYCYEMANGAKDCRDFSMFGLHCELCYECNGGGYTMHHVLFCNHCWNNVSNLLYCESCFPSVHNCFGCFGLRHTEYCVLNKQYTKEEYERLAPQIIEHMRGTGEYGEFFPPSLSVYAYNESLAGEIFPLSKEETEKLGWHWRDQTDEIPTISKVIPASQLPHSIDDVPDDILNWAVECEATKRPFKIIKQELEFYRTMRLPVPRLHPDERHRRRMALRNPRKLWDRNCAKCKKAIATTYAPDRPEIVYCESCYLQEVY